MNKWILTEESCKKIIDAKPIEVKKIDATNTFFMSEDEKKIAVNELLEKWKRKKK